MRRVRGVTANGARRARKFSVLAVVALLFCWPVPVQVRAAAGDLDSTFGNGGKLTTVFFSGSGEATSAISAIQPDKKIVVAGTVIDHTTLQVQKVAIVRYNPDGSLDPSFGSSGIAIFSFPGLFNIAIDLVIQPDGKIVVAGGASNSPTSSDFALMRVNANGSLDLTFGSGGIAVTDFARGADSAFAVALQPDGKIVVGGASRNLLDIEVLPSLVRYNSDGSLDLTFGSGGKVVADFDGPVGGEFRDLLIQPDGRIVAVGLTVLFDSNVSLARYLPDGSLDPTFGIGGMTTTDFGSQEGGRAAVLQPDGKIIVAGEFSQPITFDRDFGVARYNSDGTLDHNFGNNGLATIDFFGRNDFAETVALQRNGKIVVAGGISSNVDFSGFGDFGLARFNGDGSLDLSFSSDGKTTVDFGTDPLRFNDRVLSLAIQQDGNILAVGLASRNNGFRSDFALARFEGDGNETGNFDTCLQDDSNGNIIQINSTTGLYRFTNCAGFTVVGTGTVTQKGSVMTLQHSAADRRVIARIDTSVTKATASIQMLSQGTTFSIIDKNTANDSCACR